MIKAYAQRAGFGYADYFPSLADEKNGLRKDFTEDGVHPTLPGYLNMEPIIKKIFDSIPKKAIQLK